MLGPLFQITTYVIRKEKNKILKFRREENKSNVTFILDSITKCRRALCESKTGKLYQNIIFCTLTTCSEHCTQRYHSLRLINTTAK